MMSRKVRTNIRQRKLIKEDARRSRERAKHYWNACARDPIFWVNAFVWTLNPRKSKTPAVPFVLYDFQEVALIRIIHAILDGHDVVIEKSRDMGASWLIILAYIWLWTFYPNLSFLMMSRKEELVEKRGDPKALFSKIDFLLKYLPKFLVPRFLRKDRSLLNLDNDSTIDGETTTGESGRGDRRTSIMIDEAASIPDGPKVLKATRDATDCRILNSTPKGHDELFWPMREKCEERLTFWWPMHPEKAERLYFDDKRRPRSPWYDRQCQRCANKTEIAQELDLDYEASNFPFFDHEIMTAVRKQKVIPPLWEGDVEVDDEGVITAWKQCKDGPLKVWAPLDHRMRVPHNTDYFAGADVSMGTGASLSTLEIFAQNTRSQAAEYIAHDKDPSEFANVAVGILAAFAGPSGPAKLCWEANGPGNSFGRHLMKRGHSRVYFRTNERSISEKTMNSTPGWYSSAEQKVVVLVALRSGIASEEFIVRSEAVYEEAPYYIYQKDGSIAHERSTQTEDPSGARTNHGDRIIGCALALKCMGTSNKHEEPPEPQLPPSCFALRQRERMAARRKDADGW
jgi:hypothetical protein